MKKVLILILSLAVLFSSVSLSLAEEAAAEEKAADLFDVWDYGSEDLVWLGCAVPVSEGVLIASPLILPEGLEHLAVSQAFLCCLFR